MNLLQSMSMRSCDAAEERNKDPDREEYCCCPLGSFGVPILELHGNSNCILHVEHCMPPLAWHVSA